MMVVNIHLPDDVERRLRSQMPDLNAELQQTIALDLFKRGKISHCELAAMLGLDRFGTDAFLQRHHVTEGSLTREDLEEQTHTLDRVLGPVRRS